MVEIHAALHWTFQRPEMTEQLKKLMFFGQIWFRPRFIGAPNREAPMERGGGQGWGPDLAEKPGFSNFFGHFKPLARPMEGCVDFYHTNFSRRSHPCHPEFLLLSRMSKI